MVWGGGTRLRYVQMRSRRAGTVHRGRRSAAPAWARYRAKTEKLAFGTADERAFARADCTSHEHRVAPERAREHVTCRGQHGAAWWTCHCPDLSRATTQAGSWGPRTHREREARGTARAGRPRTAFRAPRAIARGCAPRPHRRPKKYR